LSGLSRAFEKLLSVLDLLEISYFVGGSVASGSYGLPRQTNDIDIVADFMNVDIAEFCASLKDEFYVDAASAAAAVREGRPFNVIHLREAFKFDVFPVGAEGFSQSELRRRRYIASVIPGLEEIEFPVSSPEDTILAKLVWFQKGGESSDRQWHDILGILTVQANRLDVSYIGLM